MKLNGMTRSETLKFLKSETSEHKFKINIKVSFLNEYENYVHGQIL